MTISKKIIGGYAIVLAMLALVTGVSFNALNQTQATYDRFLNVDERLLEGANELRTVAFAQQTYVRGTLLFPELRKLNRTLLQANDRLFKQTLAKMRLLMSTTEGHEQGLEFIKEFESFQEKLEQAEHETVRLALEDKMEEATAYAINHFRPLSFALIDKAAEFHGRKSKMLDKARVRLTEEVRLLTWILAAVSLFAFLAGLASGVHLSRTITRELRESIVQLSASSAEILATTTQVASGAAETAAAVSETTATVEEVKQTAQLANQKARYVSDSAQKASNVSQAGRKSVEEAIHGMRRIQEQMESIAESIVQLSEQSHAIGEIIATVNDLAEQSNLLAVNAAIEATRAGEQGKSFGVVAQEIRSLAEQSRQATGQVRTILGDIQKATNVAVLATEQGNKAVEAGVKQSTETDEAIRMLSASINEAAQAATQIAASSQQQMVGMDQVVLAMNNIKQASEQNVAGTRQAELAAQSLYEMGGRLGALVGSEPVPIARAK
ncbi:chemoreceptor-like protein with four helix bundle sensory module [Nitrosospira sp. Nsp5]|uniref:Four helix bundle sensory module for signal transduction n=1 Tax=Nitrosospira multiformis TaxID=1231 RepID=A0ABY0TIX1_9PROT|nr:MULTISPECIES: methyl-accepting chemotaxis protein [Nitrosospira]PTR05312.1 chemoreceptor-like protein with four helix bundle sensory module [Nitrosospira sp. Nsp5]SDQ91024.1 Four helix bundle sensory module for signal transduction [Nitrosospira multiformis]